MSVTGNQRQIYLGLVATLRPHFHSDLNLPERIQKLLAREKRFGSRDRRLYRELIYTTVRFLPWVESLLDEDSERAAATVAWLSIRNKATANYRSELTASWPDCPEKLSNKAAYLEQTPETLLPAWLAEECTEAFSTKEIDALNRRAPLWLRLQTSNPAVVTDEFDENEWSWQSSPIKSDAIEVTSEANVTTCKSYRQGAFEVQDLGSQLILDTNHVEAGGHWLDACAGAGGKALQLARILGSEGRLAVHDIRESAIDELLERAERAALENIEIPTDPTDNKYDGVLIDAPCSGSGTWRRSPHLKWMTTPADIEEYARVQLSLLEKYADCVNPGGQMIYATCSLNRLENERVVAAFLDRRKEYAIIQPTRDYGYTISPFGLRILPARHDTDGFFVAAMRRS
jgi:16S rRNA (cytosine967-C5)-methyltransferase